MASDSEEEGNKKKPSFDFNSWTGSGVVKFDIGSSSEQCSPERPQCNNNNNSVECICIDTTPSPQPQRRNDYAINADGHICIDTSPSPQRNNKAVSTSMMQVGSSRNYVTKNSDSYHSTSHLTGAASMNPVYSSSEEDAVEEDDELDNLLLQQGINESLDQSGLVAQNAVGSDSDDEGDKNKKLPAIKQQKHDDSPLFAPQGVSNNQTALSHLAMQDGSPYLVNTTSDHGTSHLTDVAAMNPVYLPNNTVHDPSVEVVLDNLRQTAASQQDLADHHDVEDEQGPPTRGAARSSFASFASAASKVASSVATTATAVNVASIFCRSNRSGDRAATYEQKKEANANYTGPKRAKQAAANVESSLDEILSDLLYEDGYYEESSDDDDDDDDDDDYNDEKDEDDDDVVLMKVVQAPSDTSQEEQAADLPNPLPEEQKRLYDQYRKDLDAANQLCKLQTNETRKNVTDALLDRFHYNKVQRGEAYAMGQGICGVPEHRGGINFEGEGAPEDESKFYGNPSTQGARCIADGLPPNGRRSRRVFQFNTKQLRLFGLNVRSGCHSSRDDKGREHCHKPDSIEQLVTEMIALATIKYLTAMGCFILYLNLGGWAVKPLMESVQEKIAFEMGQRNYLRHALVVPRGTHMFRLTKCIGDRNKWTASVTGYMTHMSDKVHKFFAKVVNPARTSADMNPIHEKGTLLEKLLADDRAPFVALSTDQSSWQNMKTKANEQAKDRGRKAGEALVNNLGENASKHFDLGRRARSQSEAANMTVVLKGLRSMQIDPRELLLSVGDNGGFSSLEDMKRHCESFGVSFDEAKTRWAEEMHKRRKEKYTPAEISAISKANGKKGLQVIMANLNAAGVSVTDHYSAMAKRATKEAKTYGKLVANMQELIDYGGKLYCFSCNACNTLKYLKDLGNQWEKKGQSMPYKSYCFHCKKNNTLPKVGKTKCKYWTYKGEVIGDDLTQLHAKWEEEIAKHAKGRKEKTRAHKQRYRDKKKKEKKKKKKK